MNTTQLKRRSILKLLAAAGVSTLVTGSALAAKSNDKPLGKVVIVGGGLAGATAAKYLRKWSNGRIEVILIERQKEFISCPASNEAIAGYRDFKTLHHSYDALKKNWGVKVIHASVTGINTQAKQVTTDKTGPLAYDRLILAPGFDFIPNAIAGYDPVRDTEVLHAWKAGAQSVALHQRLQALPDGGTYVLSIPKAPYRCPPGPYERASLIASYFKDNKPKAKVLILDANDKVQSKEKLFLAVWKNDYADIIEYRPNWNVISVDSATRTVTSELGDTVTADILNIVPPQRAGDIARQAGVVNVNDRWADVNWITFESTAVKDVHVIGDALQAAPLMPKSGHMANQHGKAVAAALVEIFAGRTPEPILLANTCYSLVDRRRGIHVDSVHRYNPEKKVPLVVEGSGGVSSGPTETEGHYTHAWADTIWKDTLY